VLDTALKQKNVRLLLAF